MNRRRFLDLYPAAILAALAVVPSRAGADRDASASGDLNGVVFLCATEPGSARFDAAWLDWLAANPAADVDVAIRTVLSRAGTVRSMAMPGIAPAKPGSRPDAAAISAHMAALAKQR